MPEFVQREVRERAEEPSSSENITILVGHSGDESAVAATIESCGGEFLESLPFDSLRATVPETALNGLFNNPAIETIEKDSGMESLQGN